MRRICDKWTDLSDISGEDVLDTRDLDAKLDELESLQSDYDDCEDLDEDGVKTVEPLDVVSAQMLKALRELKDEVGGWHHGTGLIRETYWREYCQQLADDMGYTGGDRNSNPLLDYVDWDQWADALTADYSVAEINGVTFYWRE